MKQEENKRRKARKMRKDMDRKYMWLSGIMGVVVGDTLGMPVQFLEREEVKAKNITGMTGNGTYSLPVGSWSDDSSLTLATLTSIQKNGEIDRKDIMDRFLDWYHNGAYTPYGHTFDIGFTCEEAIYNYFRGCDYRLCGVKDEHCNGNGSLMRIMPACLWVYEQQKAGKLSEKEALTIIHDVSALTHAHLRSKIGCGLYYFMVRAILEEEKSLPECLQKGMEDGINFYQKNAKNGTELDYYGRLFQLEDFAQTPEDHIKSSGYVVDSLEAAVWSLLTTDSYDTATLKAVNLGEDTDTIAAIAGGLAGLYYGYENIPEEWKKVIVKREWIEELCA